MRFCLIIEVEDEYRRQTMPTVSAPQLRQWGTPSMCWSPRGVALPLP